MSHHQPDAGPSAPQHAAADMLLEVINDANRIFGHRHNWLSPLTSDQERKEFIARCCEWWNTIVCPTMDRIGAVWDNRKQRFEAGASSTKSPNVPVT
jgi:hypothetical protein